MSHDISHILFCVYESKSSAFAQSIHNTAVHNGTKAACGVAGGPTPPPPAAPCAVHAQEPPGPRPPRLPAPTPSLLNITIPRRSRSSS